MPVTAPPRLLATVADLTAYLNPRPGSTTETALYERLLDAASRRAEEYSGREFLPDPPYVTETPTIDDTAAPVTRTVTLRHQPAAGLIVRIPDTRSLTQLQANGATVQSSSYELLSRTGEPATRLELSDSLTASPSLLGRLRLDLTGRFGFAKVPGDVREAVVTMAARAVYERNARLADTTVDPEGGVASYFRQIPPTVAAILDRYRIGGL